MYRTRVGYAGGTKVNPTYHDLGDHAETVQLDFDPQQISYSQLLDIFWNNHCPEVQSGKRQYASILFFHDEVQREAAEKYMSLKASSMDKRICTELAPYSGFNMAEGYHQKYYLQITRDLFAELGQYYDTLWELVDSTAAARLNGYLKGSGTVEELNAEIESLGLSEKGKKKLLRIAESY